MPRPIISFQSAAKTYRSSHLGRVTSKLGIEDFSLDIEQGEAFGLLGLNGSGKTTTFKLALGLLTPDLGKVKIFGENPSQKSVYARVGYVPELPYFHSFLTVEGCLKFYGGLSGLSRVDLQKGVEKVLWETGLISYKGVKIAQLSKGLSQRVGLAQAMIHDPEVLILDEPMSGLDPLAIRDLREYLALLVEQGKTLFISSHSIFEIEKLCHRVGVLKAGRLVRILKQKDWALASGGLEGRFAEIVGSVPLR
jgi:ABC-2 type transport system ATP-binding protein